MNINKQYFTIDELVYSDTAKKYKIDNTPNAMVLKNLKELIDFLNPLREAWGSSIRINSGYRCPELNKKVGGSNTSAHLLGWAADLWPVNGQYDKFKDFVVNYLKDKQFDQCIEEKAGTSRWVHLGIKNSAGQQRKMVFKIIK